MKGLVASRATALLAEFSAAGVLAPADVHVAQRLGRIAGEPDDRVLLAAALTVRGTRLGSVVLDLATAAGSIAPEADDAEHTDDLEVELPWPETGGWRTACEASPLVTGTAGAAPLHLDGTRLWLDRYWRQEAAVADDLLRRSADRPTDIDPAHLRADLDSLFPEDADPDQRRAVAVAALSRAAVIAGGPGTGKTTTVAQLITVLRRRLGDEARLALVAPTGKAAARLEEAVHGARGTFTDTDREQLRRLSASTVHRLLGWRPDSTSRFAHNRDNHLPVDAVVVDESSMVSLTLMARLLEAMPPSARLVLVGDPDQLASVEAGAVLGDLVDPADVGPVTAAFGAALAEATGESPDSTRPDAPGAALRESVTLLRVPHRTGEDTAKRELARLVRAGDADAALALLDAAPAEIEFHPVPDDENVGGAALAAVQAAVTSHERAVIAAARSGDAAGALDALERHRLLCAHRAGRRGVRHWSDLTERWLATDLGPGGPTGPDGRYAGQPLLVMANDYESGLYNGDTGVVVRVADEGDGLRAAFRGADGPRTLPLVRLGDVRPLHAMTVHRAQGSQCEQVTVVLPYAASALATRQTLYTALTRASDHVRIIGSAEAFRTCVERPIARATGLRDRLSGA